MSKQEKEVEPIDELKDLFKGMAKATGTGLIIGITWPFILAFLLMNPGITAVALIAIIKAKMNNEDPLKAGKEAGATSAAVKAVELLLKSLGMG